MLIRKKEKPVAKVYVLNSDGSTEAMAGIHCKNEDQELQIYKGVRSTFDS